MVEKHMTALHIGSCLHNSIMVICLHLPIVDIMKVNQIEAERVSVLINTSIKDKLEAEARNLNYLERINTLPL